MVAIIGFLIITCFGLVDLFPRASNYLSKKTIPKHKLGMNKQTEEKSAVEYVIVENKCFSGQVWNNFVKSCQDGVESKTISPSGDYSEYINYEDDDER